MKVVLCSLNSQYIHSSLAPWCLLAGVKAYCPPTVQAVVVEGTVNEPQDAVLDRVLQEQPEVVGFSTYIWNVTTVFALAKAVRKALPQVHIVLGGPEVGYRAENVLLTLPEADAVLSGEGEYPFAAFVLSLLNDTPWEQVPGLSFRTANGVHIAAPYLPKEDPVSPYSEEYFKALHGRIAYLETSRGCPYSCAFCLSGRCGTVRFFDLETTKANLLRLASSGAETIKLVDRTFNANRARAYELISFLTEHYGKEIPQGVCFHFEIAGDILDDRLLSSLANVPKGAVQLEIGLQSFCEKTLAAVHRKTDLQRLERNIRALIAPRNIHIHIDLIAGLPFEDAKTFAESFNRAYALSPDMLQFGFLKLLYGAPMREEPEEYPCTFCEEPPYEVTSTPWLSKEDLQMLHETEDAFDRIYNSGRFRRTTAYVLQTCGKTPFSLFSGFAEWKKAHEPCDIKSLDAFTGALFSYFAALPNVDVRVLRDKMVCDRLSTNSSGVLPEVLRVPDKNLKTCRAALFNNPATRAPAHTKRSVAILYSENRLVYADYIAPDPVTGEYKLNFVSFDTL